MTRRHERCPICGSTACVPMTSTAAGRMLGVCRRTMLRRAHSGAVQAFRPGTHWRFCRSDLHRYVEERRPLSDDYVEDALSL